MNWLEALSAAHPSLAQTFSLGPSLEGREMKGIKVSEQENGRSRELNHWSATEFIFQIGAAGEKKPGFWLDAGIHAREWVGPSTAIYIINEVHSTSF